MCPSYADTWIDNVLSFCVELCTRGYGFPMLPWFVVVMYLSQTTMILKYINTEIRILVKTLYTLQSCIKSTTFIMNRRE